MHLALWSLDILRTGSGKGRDFIRITRPLVHDRRLGAITSQNPYAYRFLDRTAGEGLTADLRFLRKRAASNRKFSSLEMDVIPLVDQEGDRA